MEPSEIVNVLARASELQAKIDGAICRAKGSPRRVYEDDNDQDDGFHGSSQLLPADAQKLSAIREALLDLQVQLECLQAVQKEQKFEREDLLVELEERRKLFIRRLKGYDGTEWEIIQEARAFVGEPVGREEDDLILPPYQSSMRQVPAFEVGSFKGGLSRHAAWQSPCRKTSLASRPPGNEEGDGNNVNHEPQETCRSLQEKMVNNKAKPFSGFVFGLSRLAKKAGKVVRLSAKSALVLASIIFAISQVEPQLRKVSAQRVSKVGPPANVLRERQLSSSSSVPSAIIVQDSFCPAGKVLLVQNGVQKCFVKERVEAPFEEVIRQPDASYGYG